MGEIMSDDFNKDLAAAMIEQTAGKAYDDVMHPGLEATGKVFSLLPRTIRVWFSKWEKWLLCHEYSIKETEKLLSDKLKNIPEEKIVEPEPYVAVPALQQLSYSFDSEELREMYANLLASSMNSDKKWSVHPSFVDIIKQLCPDEAKLLKYLSTHPSQPVIDVQLNVPQGGYIEILHNFTSIYEGICDNPNGIFSYLDNLVRLKIIEIPFGVQINNDSVYEQLKNHNEIRRIMSQPQPEGYKYDIQKKKLQLTAFGKEFIQICLSNK